jgi:phospholipid transport system substrate-binding protein
VLQAVLPVLLLGARPARADDPITVPIQQLVDCLLHVMKTGGPFPQRYDTLAPIIDTSFDLNTILQNSVGVLWSSMSSDQQGMLLTAFRHYTVASYVNNFDTFDGQQFTVAPTPQVVGTKQIVQTRLVTKSGDGHALDYVMRETSSGWRAVDVLLEGTISRVAVQRSDFRRLLAHGGAEALANSLRVKFG